MSTLELVLYICGTIGVLDTCYLIYHKIMGTDVACWFFPAEWCRTVQYSPQSKTLGIPNSVAGLIMYGTILLLVNYMYITGSSTPWLLQGIISFGFLFSMYFLYVQGFVLRAFCTWCVLSAINFTVMFLAVWFL